MFTNFTIAIPNQSNQSVFSSTICWRARFTSTEFKLPHNVTLVQYLVHCCQIRIGKWVTFRINVKWSTIEQNTSIIEYSKTPPTQNNIKKSQFFSTTVRRFLKGQEPIFWFALPTDQLLIFSMIINFPKRGDLAHWYARRFVHSGPGFDYRRPLIF